MKNPATNAKRSDFNEFTRYLYVTIKDGKKPSVRLRNGAIVQVDWNTKDGPDYEYFYCHDGIYYIWNNDGHSITSADFDIMELV